MIRITSKREGFRRCGVAHSKAAVDWPDDRFSEEELATLKAEPMLLVTEIKVEEGPCRDGEEKAPDGHEYPDGHTSGAEAAGSPPEGSGEVEQPTPQEAECPEGHKYPEGHKSGAGEEKHKEKAPVPRNKGKGKR